MFDAAFNPKNTIIDSDTQIESESESNVEGIHTFHLNNNLILSHR